MSGAKRYCCKTFKEKLNWKCDQHSDPYDCADAILVEQKVHGFGIPIHDGGSSMIKISFCPWCGSRLTKDSSADRTIEV